MKKYITTVTTVRVGLKTLDEVTELTKILLANSIIDFKIHKDTWLDIYSVNYLVKFDTKDYALVDLLNRLNWIK